MKELSIQAPAKINLCLHVLGRRLNGYHELAMVMQSVSLFDTVHLRLKPKGGISVACDGVELEDGEENIAAKAARLILSKAQVSYGVEISIEKRIPVAAGLGGGSSDAAAVLTGLNRLLELNLSKADLQELGGQIGSDVPFFIFGRPALATGAGTTLSSLPPLPEVAYLLVNPGFAVSTRSVYQSLQLTKGGHLANLPRFSAVTKGDLCAALHNDLESVVLECYPEVARVKEQLTQVGALGALMSGSGATVFGLFDNFQAASDAGESLKKEFGWKVFPVVPLGLS